LVGGQEGDFAELCAAAQMGRFVCGDFPYLMTKLLIPQVNGYQDSPEEYIYNRLLALYCQLHYTGFGRVDLARQGRDPIDWHDEALTKLWSSVNRESAEKYSEAVEQLERAELRRSTFPG
jgi:hypothetical protein